MPRWSYGAWFGTKPRATRTNIMAQHPLDKPLSSLVSAMRWCLTGTRPFQWPKHYIVHFKTWGKSKFHSNENSNCLSQVWVTKNPCITVHNITVHNSSIRWGKQIINGIDTKFNLIWAWLRICILVSKLTLIDCGNRHYPATFTKPVIHCV